MMALRPYQNEAVQACYGYMRDSECNPCIVLPTGTGKSLVIAQIVHDAVTRWQSRVIILAHVKELLEQNASKIKAMRDVPISLYSAGLGSREKDGPCIVAGIQSVYTRACELGKFDIAIIDEAHLIPTSGEGMYRRFLADAKVVNPHMRVIGLTATPYRLNGGMICAPENILHEICYEANLRDMIRDGYLAPLVGKAGKAKVNTDSLPTRGGEFVERDMEAAFAEDAIVASACTEIADLTADRKSVLIFCAGIDHAEKVAAMLRKLTGQRVEMVTGSTPAHVRAEYLAAFKGQGQDMFGEQKRIKYLVNVNVLTTGFDAPNVDCVVLLRATLSTGLYVQMVGRGTRLAPGKENCMILDYGNNILRHGPVDAVCPPKQSAKGEKKENKAKQCEGCGMMLPVQARVCPSCGFAFISEDQGRHEAQADTVAPLATIEDVDYRVLDVTYRTWQKRGAPDAPETMRIDYIATSGEVISEWACPGHSGFARRKFEAWWRSQTLWPMPSDAQEAVQMAQSGALAIPEKITGTWKSGQRWPEKIKLHIRELVLPPEEVMAGFATDMADDPAPYDDDDIPF